MRLRVRWGRLQDAEQVAGVHVRAWQAGYRGLLPQELLDGLRPQDRLPRWASALAAADPPRSGTLVAEVAEVAEVPEVAGAGRWRVAGFALLGPSRDEGDPERASGEPVGEVMSFYVDTDAWRTGVGSALMRASLVALADAGCARACLWVLDGNERAIAFYRRTGWTLDGARREDAVGGRTIHDVRMLHALQATPRVSLVARPSDG